MPESFRSVDSLENATSNSWIVNVKFASGEQNTYDQAPKMSVGYAVFAKGDNPKIVTNINLQAKTPNKIEFSLSLKEILKLRRAGDGRLGLVIYDEGIGCMSPATTKAFKDVNEKQGYSEQNHFEMLRAKKGEILNWTRDALTN